MADPNQPAGGGTGRGHGGLYFIVGLLVAAVVVLGFLYFNGNLGNDRDVNVTVDPPKTGDSPTTGDTPSNGN